MHGGEARTLRAWAAAVAAVAACRSEEAAPERKYFEPEPWVPIPTTPSKDPLSPAEDAPRKPNPADGVCKRANVSSGIVDPDCVYLLGMAALEFGSEMPVLIDPFRPEDQAYGFGHVTRMAVHPRTGELWFLSVDEDSRRPAAIYVHQENRHALLYTWKGMLDGQRWIPTPTCPHPFPAPGDFGLFRDDGIPAIRCSTGEILVPTQSDSMDLQGGVPVALGNDRVVLALNPPSSYSVVNATVANRIQWIDYDRFIAARARPGGGFVAVVSSPFPDQFPRLWNVELDGSVTSLGTYDLGPPRTDDLTGDCLRLPTGEISCGTQGGSCALDASAALFCINFTGTAMARAGIVVRFTLNGPPLIVYDERDSQVKVRFADLVTGP
ncbi:MAG: hypothetical protein JST00_43285 [Deltaproteobacteria bacterium]|nr:hypothetical protein [Deltaproteobacteria bacterium]